jgi:EpsI family protein
MSLFRSRVFTALTVVLLLQGTAYYALALRNEKVPTVAPLADFPRSFGEWSFWREVELDKEVIEVLKSDDTLQRAYMTPSGKVAWLFIALFKTQRTGQSPHSPKNCLPGSGWEPIINDRPAIEVPGESHPIVINRYVTQKGTEKTVVLYWYQSHGRVVANEFAAKFWSVADAMRYNRSDTSLVRITVPVMPDGDIDRSVQIGYEFAKAVFPSLMKQLPG